MNRYSFTAIDLDGHRHKGNLFAESEQALHTSLQQKQLELLTLKIKNVTNVQTKVDIQTLIIVCIQLEQLLKAGVPLLQALEELAMHMDHEGMEVALRRLHHALQAGKLLSQAMQAQPAVFPSFMCHLVHAGEHVGQLPEIFAHLAATLQWQADLQSQLRRGLAYPALLCVMVLIAAAVMLTYVVPQMAGFLQSLGQALPWSTRALIATSTWALQDGVWLLIACMGMLIAAIYAYKHSPIFALKVDGWLLQWPIVGPLLQHMVLARMCRFLGLMYHTGIPLLEAIRLCQSLLGNRFLANLLDQVRREVQAGEGLAQSFSHSRYFPPLLVRMVRIGESTGALDRMLSQLSAFYDQQVQTQMQLFLRMLEPALTMVMGLMLILLMASVMLPVYDSFSSLHY